MVTLQALGRYNVSFVAEVAPPVPMVGFLEVLLKKEMRVGSPFQFTFGGPKRSLAAKPEPQRTVVLHRTPMCPSPSDPSCQPWSPTQSWRCASRSHVQSQLSRDRTANSHSCTTLRASNGTLRY